MKIGKAYTACGDLPLIVFIKVLIDGNLKRLVKFGVFSDSALQVIWNAIFQEYMALTKNDAHTHLFNAVKEYTVLRNKIVIAEALLQVLAFKRSQAVIDALKKLGISYAFKDSSFEADFKQAVGKLKSWVFRAEKLYKDLQDQPESEELSESAFSEQLAELGAFQGYRLDIKKITVTEYVAVLNRYKKQVDDGKRRKNN